MRRDISSRRCLLLLQMHSTDICMKIMHFIKIERDVYGK